MSSKRIQTFNGLTYGTPLQVNGRRAVFVEGHGTIGWVFLAGTDQAAVFEVETGLLADDVREA